MPGAPAPPGPGSPSAVALVGVTKRYGEAVALSALSLEAEPGELLVLVGPSGCGKTTVLRLVAGLEEPTEGMVRIGGEVANGVDPKDRDVAMVFQSYALYPHMTVARNIEFPLRSRRVPRGERQRAVVEVARNLQIDHLLQRKPAALSGGQRQRVALARAIVRRPRVFLMDEPLSNLDAQLRVEMRAALVELQQRLATTVVYVTHDQVEAVTMGRRLAVLDKGALQQIDTPSGVQARPANAFVAGFIGSPPMNVIAGTLGAGARPGAPGAPGAPDASYGGTNDCPTQISVPGGQLPLSDAQGALLASRGLTQVLAGLRAEELEIDPAGTLTATVRFVESFGAERIAACRLGAVPAGTSRLVMVRVPPSARSLRTGDHVLLAARREVLLFDPATGVRIDA